MVLGLGYLAFQKIPPIDAPIWNQNIVFSGIDYVLILICMMLSFVNWLLESLKWQYLLQPLRSLGFIDAIKEVLMAHTTGVLTPGRVGEYVTKGLLQPKENRWMSLLLHAWGSFGLNGIQLMVAGGVLYFWSQLFSRIPLLIGQLLLIVGLVHLIIFLMPNILVYLGRKFQKLPWLGRWVQLSDSNSGPLLFSLTRKASVLLLSFARYVVYLLQFGMLLYHLVPAIPIEQALCGAALVYGLQTLMPLSPFLSFVARGELALLVFQSYGSAWSAVLLASLVLWIINVFLPALAGSWWGMAKKKQLRGIDVE